MTVFFFFFFLCTIFEAYLIIFLRFSEVKFFTLHSPGLERKKNRKHKIYGFKNVMERGIKKILTFEIRLIASKIYVREIKTEVLINSKRLKFA